MVNQFGEFPPSPRNISTWPYRGQVWVTGGLWYPSTASFVNAWYCTAMSHNHHSKALQRSATCRPSILRSHLYERPSAKNKSPASNACRIEAVVRTIQNVTKGSHSLDYLSRDEESAPVGDDIRIKHLRDKGRSLADRLKHGLASLSLAEQYENWRCVCYLDMPGKRIDLKIPAPCDSYLRHATLLRRKYTTMP